MRVQVISGPLRDQIGLLGALHPHERVLVLLQLLTGRRGVRWRRARGSAARPGASDVRDRWMGVRDLPISLKQQSLPALGHFPSWTTRHQAEFYYGRETFPKEGPKRLV